MIDICKITAGEIRKALSNYKISNYNIFNDINDEDDIIIDKITNVISVMQDHYKFDKSYSVYKQLYKVIDNYKNSRVCQSIFKTNSACNEFETNDFHVIVDSNNTSKNFKKLTMEDLFY